MSLGFVIDPSKSEFIPFKTIEYLGFVINTEDITIRLAYANKMIIFNICTSTLKMYIQIFLTKY